MANLGAIQFSDADSPLPIEDVRFSARPLNFGVVGLIPYTVNGEMRFYCMSSDPSVGAQARFHANAQIQHQRKVDAHRDGMRGNSPASSTS
ncbi:MAG: hypothetical protein ACRD22_00850 [Terriglobia bacterium]